MIHFSSIEKEPQHALQLFPAHVRAAKNKKIIPHRFRSQNGLLLEFRGTARFIFHNKRNQRCIVKVSYTKNTSSRSWAVHGEYLQREHAQSLGERGFGFNDESNAIDIKLTLRSWQEADDPHMFKIIVSPENGHRMDLQQHARDLIHQMEHDLDIKLDWVGIDHHNTDHPHVHIVIRGLDDVGNSLVIDPHYLSHEIRHQSEDLATRELGLRRELDISQSLQREITLERVTSLDRSILNRADENNTVNYRTTVPDDHDSRTQRLREISRLKQLENFGLAEQVDTKAWRVDDNLSRKLSELQRANDISDAFSSHSLSPTYSLTPTSIDEEPLTGKVIGMGLQNALHDNRYLIVEDTQQKLHYIEANNSIVKAHDNFEFSNGDTITLQRQTFINDQNQEISYIKVQTHDEPELKIERSLHQSESSLEPSADQQLEKLFSYRESYLTHNPDRAASLTNQIIPDDEKFTNELKQQFHAIRLEMNDSDDRDHLQRELRQQAFTISNNEESMNHIERNDRDFAREIRELAREHEKELERELKRELELKKELGLKRTGLEISM